MIVPIRHYGYYDHVSYANQKLSATPGQSVAGYPIGILALELFYPLVPGNVVNPWTYDFPVRIKVVRGATIDRIFRNDPTLLDDFIQAGEELMLDGVRALSGACGFFANYQRELAEHFPVPVAMSSLLQVPWIKSSLKKDQKVGIITANSAAITPYLLESVGITDGSAFVVKGIQHLEQWKPLVDMEDNGFNDTILTDQVSQAAVELCQEENIGAILLECSDLPPYAHAIQKAVNLPVYDYITMMNWLYHSVCQRPYEGYF
ncbi:aspartate/glutamate racemase family protein [Bacilliculturomica massiliensis]|uniref:aspartate/glutamate racemase family protein n=1 Tax=Bacilliculturomica massiliensis TaxID=1917867 RepID=UPI0010308C77|nr:aspartate/glutamate racemase family protein [Bacilliculturomica massiliensis]